MAIKYILGILLTHNMLVYCASAAVHDHSIDNVERESDGSFRARGYDHYGDSGHNSEFDHEAILGSVKEAEKFDSLSPEEAKAKLAEILVKMDLNGNKLIDRIELKKWILKSFINLSREETEERLQEADEDQDGSVSWPEYLHLFGVDTEDEAGPEDTGDSGLQVKTEDDSSHARTLQEEKAMWAIADANSDGKLELDEFQVFTNPEEHPEMHQFLVNQTLREKDTNKDGKIDFTEYIGERGSQQDKEWLVAEKDKFDHELDVNSDGVIDLKEITAWIIPDNEEIASEEVDHLFAAVDDNHDDVLSFEEVLGHVEMFVGSSGGPGDMYGEHFDDEL